MVEFENAILIRDKTRLEQLIERFNSKAQAQFYIERSGGDFDSYELEHHTFYESLSKTQEAISKYLKFKIINRSFLPTYLFTNKDLIVVIGQDGLVANTAKYVTGLPIIGINPDIERYDGTLLKHSPKDINKLLKNVINHNYDTTEVTMAKAQLSDGQTLYAFNDFYIGAATHVSSRYTITFNGQQERQSSSGIIVSTGAGSTGWLSSIFNMTNTINNMHHKNSSDCGAILNWDANKLVFVVREPFLSKQSQIGIGYGVITKRKTLTIESHMASKGVIFSDGIETDFINFNSGNIVEIGIAKEKASLVI